MIALALIGQAASQTGIEKFANALTSGIALGAIYALLALGFVIIFKAKACGPSLPKKPSAPRLPGG